MFKEDLSVDAIDEGLLPTAASVSSSLTSTAVRVLRHEGGVTHNEREATRQCETV